MDAKLYREILFDYLFPFIAEKYDFNIKLHQDNDPKHTSKLCRAVLSDNDIIWVTILKFSKKILTSSKKFYLKKA